MKKNSLLGILITYNPSINQLENNIGCITDQVDKLIIVDNASGNKREIQSMRFSEKIDVIFLEKNVGLGKAYNLVLDKYYKDFKYFITFDQDTQIPMCALEKMMKIMDSNLDIDVLGPSFSREPSKISNGKIIYKTAIIQSSAMFRASVYDKVGKFNENYFIDSVDFEYCLRVWKYSKKVAIYTGINICHQLGTEKSAFGVTYISHNNIRNYYMSRNHFALTKQYWKDFPYYICKKNVFFFLHILKVAILERDIEKLKYINYGIRNRELENSQK